MSNIQPKKPFRDDISFWFTCGTLGIFLVIMGAISIFMFNSAKRVIYNSGRIARVTHGFIKLDTLSSRYILRCGLPVLERSAGEEDPIRLFELDWAGIYWRLAANIRHTNSQEILKTQFPSLAMVKLKPKPIFIPPPPVPVEPKSEEQPPPPQLSSEPEILIYHTHTSESYLPVSGKEHLLNKKGDIVKVGERLKDVLKEKYQINAIHCEEIHDQPPFKESYERSQVTVRKYLQKYPSLKILIDLHRDATPGLNAVCNIKNERTATVLLVVGSDKMKPHPNWRKNLAFARRVADTMNLYYPGLSSGIIVSKGRYNQHLHERSLIFEFGDQNSTWKELNRTVEIVAEILAITMKEEFHQP